MKWYAGQLFSTDFHFMGMEFYDKLAHFIRDFMICFIVARFSSAKKGLLYACVFAVIYELKDSLLWMFYNPALWWLDHIADPRGGDICDLISGIIGAITAFAVVKFIKKSKN